MAITSAGDLAGMMNAAGTIAATITGVKRLYEQVGEIPPDTGANDLPAILQSVTGADLPPGRMEVGGVDIERFHHYWYLDLLLKRDGDLHAEQQAAMPFIPLVKATFNANRYLGNRLIVDYCQPETYRFVIVSFGEQSFFAIRFLMHAQASWAVTYTDPS